MEVGVLLPLGGIYSTGLAWIPKDIVMKKTFMPITRHGVKKVGGEVIKIQTNDLAMSGYTDVHICRKCRKLILNY